MAICTTNHRSYLRKKRADWSLQNFLPPTKKGLTGHEVPRGSPPTPEPGQQSAPEPRTGHFLRPGLQIIRHQVWGFECTGTVITKNCRQLGLHSAHHLQPRPKGLQVRVAGHTRDATKYCRCTAEAQGR